jgi:hypothetical protein
MNIIIGINKNQNKKNQNQRQKQVVAKYLASISHLAGIYRPCARPLDIAYTGRQATSSCAFAADGLFFACDG